VREDDKLLSQRPPVTIGILHLKHYLSKQSSHLTRTALVAPLGFFGDNKRMQFFRFFPPLFLLAFIVTSTAWAKPVPQAQEEEGYVPVHAIAFSPNGKYLAASSTIADEAGKNSSVVNIWNIATGDEWRMQTTPPQEANHIVFSPDGKRLAMVQRLDDESENSAIVWELQTFNIICYLESDVPEASPWVVAFTADGKQIVGTTMREHQKQLDSGIVVWNADTGKVERRFESVAPAIPAIAFVDQEQSLLALTIKPKAKGRGNELLVLDAQSGKVTRTISLENSASFEFCLSPDGNTLARYVFARASRPAGAPPMFEQYLELRDWRSDRPARRLELPAIDSIQMQYTPDSKQLLTVGKTTDQPSRHTLWRWDVASGKLLGTMALSDYAVPGPFKYAFSPDGKLLAMPGAQDKLQVFDTSDGRLVKEFDLLAGEE